MTRHTTSRRPAIALAALLGLATAVTAEVGVTDGPKGVVVNTRNGKAYAAFPDLGIVNPVTNKLYVSASTGTDPSVIDLATKSSTTIHAGTEGNALSVNVKANKIYFVGYEDNFVTVVDGVTNEPARIEVPGFHQWDSAFNETSGFLYLPTPNNNAITVIDTRTGVVSMVGTGSVPMAAAVNEVTNRIYVVNYASSDVTVIDGASNRPIATVTVGLWPQQIAINTETNMIYVVNTHANSVSVIDGRTNTVAATVPADKGPWALAVNPVSDMIYVANRLSDKVTVIDGRTNRAVQR